MAHKFLKSIHSIMANLPVWTNPCPQKGHFTIGALSIGFGVDDRYAEIEFISDDVGEQYKNLQTVIPLMVANKLTYYLDFTHVETPEGYNRTRFTLIVNEPKNGKVTKRLHIT